MKGIVSLILVSLMFGCGNDSSQENEEIISEAVPDKFGLIMGSKLSGLKYQSGELSGYTDEDGRFGYLEGEMIQFFVGDIAIGYSVEPKETLAIYDLSAQDPFTTINITRFLLTLDDDGEARNGINIEQSIHQQSVNVSLDFSSQLWELSRFGSTDLEDLLLLLTSQTSTGAKTLVSSYIAYAYLTSPLDELMNGLENQIIDEFKISECETDNQCKFHLIPTSYLGFCAPLPDVYVYSDVTTNVDNVQLLTEQRTTILKDKLDFYAAADVPKLGGVCFNTQTPQFPVCNNSNNCEISDEIPIVIIE